MYLVVQDTLSRLGGAPPLAAGMAQAAAQAVGQVLDHPVVLHLLHHPPTSQVRPQTPHPSCSALVLTPHTYSSTLVLDTQCLIPGISPMSIRNCLSPLLILTPYPVMPLSPYPLPSHAPYPVPLTQAYYSSVRNPQCFTLSHHPPSAYPLCSSLMLTPHADPSC